MTKYKLEISQTAEKQFKKLPKKEQKRITTAMLSLAKDPYPKGSKKLTGYKDVFRIRSGKYRIIYSVQNKRLIITVLKVAHRKNVYQNY